MIKHYSGFRLPAKNLPMISFSIEWLCPKCGSEDVDLVGEPYRGFCDGGPSTSHEFSDWKCLTCGFSANGRGNGAEKTGNPFKHRVFDFKEHSRDSNSDPLNWDSFDRLESLLSFERVKRLEAGRWGGKHHQVPRFLEHAKEPNVTLNI
ncbi:hypothetical protein [Ruegeria arenilitoris]|uniref:hypothetical protein n=1 Tax=Ruegeria arenilitoris TaxID=1173585 RepID=UPI001481366F|nr:hypothetical protein [Ruegeria arenilitoris]